MISRSGHVCAHSAPTAPAWNLCSKIVQRLATADTNTNGTSAETSRRPSRPVCHHTQRASTKGNMTTEGLLRVARMKKTKDRPNHRIGELGSRRNGEFVRSSDEFCSEPSVSSAQSAV